jgi:hypothetical protein
LLIERPHVGEDEAGEIACRNLFEDPAAEFAYEAAERWSSEGKEVQDQVDGVVIVEELQAGSPREFMADRHLSDGGWPDDENEC